ncbi:DUF1244 domain-containing protein [Vibrio salinus]|uniref:DUF1244 domain-containing protein n=1 Tax=Vibrio salinus TaxID=2899784 RepID=UPI001E64E374|nr:DUF1244 domain-containing protein [Vibrio salinus]MCE0494683.1 DUF1244 domain-containing protein [Vibrio salinus]
MDEQYQQLPDELKQHIDAAVFSRLLSHLSDHPEVKNLELMLVSGFCRDTLAQWYIEEAKARGYECSAAAAESRIYTPDENQ